MQPYLVHLNKSFTTYELKRIADLSSTHSIRLFELLQQFKSTGFYTVSVEGFRELLELGPSYERYSNLKLKVLNPAIAELREKSGLLIELTTEKKGRAISRLIFKFRDDDQMRLNFPESVDNSRNP
ncbi:replication initiation protein (plasmid) [Pseudomonas lundensis]|nr:replication initiation protein [Pseudomonas lundensis]QVQ83858.1 replication initiation protein [Pseudomonas lundensis]